MKTARLINMRIHPDIDKYIRERAEKEYKKITEVVNEMLVYAMRKNPIEE